MPSRDSRESALHIKLHSTRVVTAVHLGAPFEDVCNTIGSKQTTLQALCYSLALDLVNALEAADIDPDEWCGLVRHQSMLALSELPLREL